MATGIDLFKIVGIADDGLFLEVTDNPMCRLWRSQIQQKKGVEERALNQQDEQTLQLLLCGHVGKTSIKKSTNMMSRIVPRLIAVSKCGCHALELRSERIAFGVSHS